MTCNMSNLASLHRKSQKTNLLRAVRTASGLLKPEAHDVPHGISRHGTDQTLP